MYVKVSLKGIGLPWGQVMLNEVQIYGGNHNNSNNAQNASFCYHSNKPNYNHKNHSFEGSYIIEVNLPASLCKLGNGMFFKPNY